MRRHFQRWELTESQPIKLEEDTLGEIITQEGMARLMVEWADKLGATFKATKLTSSQIRNVFGEVRKIEQSGYKDPGNQRRFILLIPKLQYAAARAKTPGMDGLRSVLVKAIDLVNGDADNFRRFVEFFEAILAYHKAHGGD